MEKLFKLKEHGTDVRTEVIAGITTFLAMAYILAVNPSMLAAAGMDHSGFSCIRHTFDGIFGKLSGCTCFRYGS